MRPKKIIPLFVVVTLLLAVFWLAIENRQLRQQIDSAADKQRQLQHLTENNAQQRVQFEDQIAGLNRQLASSAYQLSQLSNTLQETRLALEPDYETVQPGSTEFSALLGPDNGTAMANARIPRLYDSYLNALGIPGTERQQAMAALVDFGVQRYQLLSELISGSLSPNQALAYFGEHALASNMGMHLNSEQQDDLREYDLALKRDTLREVYQQELLRSGSAIAGLLQEQVLQTLLAEVVSAENNWGALVAADGSMLSAHRDKIAALDRARDQLVAQLGAEQILQLDRLIEAQSNSVDVILEASPDSSGRASITQLRIGVEDLPQ